MQLFRHVNIGWISPLTNGIRNISRTLLTLGANSAASKKPDRTTNAILGLVKSAERGVLIEERTEEILGRLVPIQAAI
jgi:hypothetical protein